MTLVLSFLAVVLALPFLVTLAGTVVLSRRYRPTGRFLDVRGTRLHFRDTGPDGRDHLPPVVVLHGASGNLEEARLALGPALADRRVVFVDRPGHGHSGRPDRRLAAPAEQADLVAGLLDRLGIRRAVIVGHSWGGSVAAALGVLHPGRVAGLVFVAPATHPWPGGVAWYHGLIRTPVIGSLFLWTVPLPLGLAILRASARAVFTPDPLPDGYVERGRIALVLRPATFRANSEDISGLKANLIALAPRYREISAPTVVVTGDTDPVVAPSIHSEGLVRDIPGAELVVLKGVGHMPHHVRPDVVADAVRQVSARAESVADTAGTSRAALRRSP